ncbi:helix-turn-helix domain-containing protein [Burkholderia cepacia]|uniref:helix-turn-helix domain-containing protein n=1 Tax=Burkholderia cepacia TaxID=292 RepID=UPI0009BEACD4|nr:helix-turn-helix domain-containing protein [Burkholderia cepacia]
MEKNEDGVLYVYRCPACGKRGEVHHPDDSYDGAAATCAKCYGPVTLEWDGGVTFEIAPRVPVGHPPTAAELVGLRTRHGRTQAGVAERLGVTPRQVQRWEAGVGKMPVASWQLLSREWGTRFREDFAMAPGPMTRGWDTLRDTARDTIERGDVVHLQAIAGPLIVATVCVDRVHDGLVDEHGYGAIVTGLGTAYPAGAPLELFILGERVSFARDNVIHLEQPAPRAGVVDRSVKS